MVAAPLRIVPPEFADDPTLDVAAHLRVVGVPSRATRAPCSTCAAALAEQPLDRARPLWEFTLIDGLPDGRAALLQKLHHTITDGVGGLRLSLALVDFERNPEPATTDDGPVANGEESGPATTPFAVTRDAVVDATHRTADVMWRAVGTTSHVVVTPERSTGARGRSRALARLAPTSSARHRRRPLRRDERPVAAPPLRDAQSRSHRCAWRATKLGGSVNDVFVTGLASALGRYHERLGSDATELRLAMPDQHTRDRATTSTNRFVPARVLVPIQPADDIPELFAAVHDRLDTAKREEALTAADALAGVVSALPTSLLVACTRSQTRTIDFAASNLRGSPVPLYLAGARIIASYPFGPRTGSALERRRCSATATTCTSAATSTRRRSSTPPRSCATSATRSRRSMSLRDRPRARRQWRARSASSTASAHSSDSGSRQRGCSHAVTGSMTYR